MHSGKQSAVISCPGFYEQFNGQKIFSATPLKHELIYESLAKNVFCSVPLSLPIIEDHTYPHANPDEFSQLKSDLDLIEFDVSSVNSRLGNVIVLYNVLKHFYPYDDVLDIDWTGMLKAAIRKSFIDESLEEHILTLRSLMAGTHDGHASIYGGNLVTYSPPIFYEKIESRIVVTEVLEDELGIQPGDVIDSIDGFYSEDFYYQKSPYFSKTSDAHFNQLMKFNNAKGEKDTELEFVISGRTIKLKRSIETNAAIGRVFTGKERMKKYDGNIIYLNLTQVSMPEIVEQLTEISDSDGIILDLRGYPVRNHEIISHFFKSDDTTKNWLRVPNYIYPDQKNSTNFDGIGWNLKAKTPYIGNKPSFLLVDGNTFSYGESITGFFQGYGIATLIGQTTAGTNGTVNPFDLLGGINVRWTGMRVVKHDGSQLQGIGFTPDVLVTKTRQGIAEGRDEVLEKALELAREQIANDD